MRQNREWLRIFFRVASIVVTTFLSTGAEAQYYRTVPAYPVPQPPVIGQSRGAIGGRAIEQGYYYSQQQQEIRQWQEQQRQLWLLDQQRKQQWLQQQNQLRYLQQQQQRSFVQPHANSTPMFVAPVPYQQQQQRAQQWQQQYQSRQQTLQQWRMQPLPRR
ncbi:MAG: hypothetical protein HYX37_09395 [Rhizobiales bacterium]|nr:hypothetical protein [Hyphomicrobiales bacterium]